MTPNPWLALAFVGAEGSVYEVKPQDELEEDPSHYAGGLAWRCRSAKVLRVESEGMSRDLECRFDRYVDAAAFWIYVTDCDQDTASLAALDGRDWGMPREFVDAMAQFHGIELPRCFLCGSPLDAPGIVCDAAWCREREDDVSELSALLDELESAGD